MSRVPFFYIGLFTAHFSTMSSSDKDTEMHEVIVVRRRSTVVNENSPLLLDQNQVAPVADVGELEFHSPRKSKMEQVMSYILPMAYKSPVRTGTTVSSQPPTAKEMEEDEFAAYDYFMLNQYKEHKVIATLLLMGICCLMLFVILVLAGFTFAPVSVNPMLGPSSDVLLEAGASSTLHILRGDWYRLIMPMFLHAGFIHLGLNVVVLRNIGTILETEYGAWKVLCGYLLSGVSGTLTSVNFLPRMFGVGASGAIYGLIGMVIGDLYHNWKYTENKTRVSVSLGISLVLAYLIGLLPMMDNFAHLGGLIAGTLFGVAVTGHAPLQRRYKIDARIQSALSLGLLAAWFILQFYILYDRYGAGNEVCTWCHKLNCVPTALWSCSVQASPCIKMYSNGTQVPIPIQNCL